jgi:hypothetical protein
MQSLGLAEATGNAEPRKGFWKRQFQKESTEPQRRFDWLFGVVLPVVCFAFDPVVFKTVFREPALLGAFKPFAYVLSFVSVMAMAAWLIWGAKLKWLSAFLVGLFAVGGLISLAVGIVLSPFSLIGLIFLIGILGFTPLFTSIVFLRNAVRAFHAAKPFFEKGVLINSFMLSAVLSFALPTVLNMQIEKALGEMRDGDARAVRARARNLKYVAPLVDFERLDRESSSENNVNDEEKRAAMLKAYRDLTGKSMERDSFSND